MSESKNALHVLMKSARDHGGHTPQHRLASSPRSLGASNPRKRLKTISPRGTGGGKFFPCPAGCGAHVTERDVNSHLDRCTVSMNVDVEDSASAEGPNDRARSEDKPEDAEQKEHGSEEGDHVSLEKSAKSKEMQQKHPAKAKKDKPSVLIRRNETEPNHNHGTKLDFDRRTKRDNQSNEMQVKEFSKLSPEEGNALFATSSPAKKDGTENIFAHMMKRSAALFSKSENVTRQRFHLHNVDGFVTWTSDDDEEHYSKCKPTSGGRANGESIICIGDSDRDDLKQSASYGASIPPKKHSFIPSFSDGTLQWSETITIKKPQIVSCQSAAQHIEEYTLDGPTKRRDDKPDKSLELTISSSIPFLQEGLTRHRLVRVHSRLSVAHLKSCLQKSIRRRAPLPAVRVAMELADKSWGDLIRRLPIIVLEDSTLHPDFPLLVWLMVADSKVRHSYQAVVGCFLPSVARFDGELLHRHVCCTIFFTALT